jgi:hypothetical protein
MLHLMLFTFITTGFAKATTKCYCFSGMFTLAGDEVDGLQAGVGTVAVCSDTGYHFGNIIFVEALVSAILAGRGAFCQFPDKILMFSHDKKISSLFKKYSFLQTCCAFLC